MLLHAVGLSGCYFAELAAGQLALVNRQQPIDRASMREPDPERRRLLDMVPELRGFARNRMQLRPGRNYTGYYATEAEGIVFVLSASERTRFAPHLFWFPIIGEAAYKSYFDRDDAIAAERELKLAGYDTWLGRATAYSTLGFFRDPVTTMMMRKGSLGFVEVLLHEMAHGRLYVPGETDWNERSPPSSVSAAQSSTCARALPGDAVLMDELTRRKERRERVEAVTAAAVHRARGALRPRPARGRGAARARAAVCARVSRALRELLPEAEPWEISVNNARLLQYRRYSSGAERFERMWARAQGSWVRFWQLCERYGVTLG